MSPRVRSAPDAARLRPRAPGVLEGVDDVVAHDGGPVLLTCGVCGYREFIDVPPPRPYQGTYTELLRALRRSGWRHSSPWGWVQLGCLADVRAAVRAGHLQLTLMED